mmetsp:Transcript_132001/g.410331  ORF Transcript_132001/g.410331 Transcript_132001/m.410331 type:complete len:223 (+) Transcript_132001:369-1037(+)
MASTSDTAMHLGSVGTLPGWSSNRAGAGVGSASCTTLSVVLLSFRTTSSVSTATAIALTLARSVGADGGSGGSSEDKAPDKGAGGIWAGGASASVCPRFRVRTTASAGRRASVFSSGMYAPMCSETMASVSKKCEFDSPLIPSIAGRRSNSFWTSTMVGRRVASTRMQARTRPLRNGLKGLSGAHIACGTALRFRAFVACRAVMLPRGGRPVDTKASNRPKE